MCRLPGKTSIIKLTLLMMTDRDRRDGLRADAFLSRKLIKSLKPPSLLLAALLCFKPCTRRYVNPASLFRTRAALASAESEIRLDRAEPSPLSKCFTTFWATLEKARGFLAVVERVPVPFLVVLDAPLVLDRLPVASMSRSPSSSTLRGPLRF